LKYWFIHFQEDTINVLSASQASIRDIGQRRISRSRHDMVDPILRLTNRASESGMEVGRGLRMANPPGKGVSAISTRLIPSLRTAETRANMHPPVMAESVP
jgi:hypothetical protein